MQTAENENSKLWMVRSNGRILGPYKSAQLIELLKTRELVVHDECALPIGRWYPIRETPDFLNVCKQLDIPQKSTDVTATLAHQTVTASHTDALLDFTVVGSLPPILDTGSIEQIAREIKTIPVQEPLTNSPGVSQATAKSYGFSGDRAVRRKVSSNLSKWLWFSAVAFLIAASVVIYSNKVKEVPKTIPSLSFEKLVENGYREKKIGEYDKAIQFFARASQLKPAAVEPMLQKAILTLRNDDQTVAIRRTLNEVLSLDYSDNSLKLAHTALGVVGLFEDKLAEAEGEFQQALVKDPRFIPAIFDRGMVHFIKKEYDNALKQFYGLEEQGYPIATLMMAHSWNQLSKLQNTKQEEFVKRALDRLQTLATRSKDYSFEASFLTAYFHSLSSDPEKLEKVVIQFISKDPTLTEEHFHDPLIFDRIVKWKFNQLTCREIATKLNNQGLKNTLLAVCAYKAGEKIEAQTFFERSLQTQGSQYSLGQYAHMLLTSGDTSKAMALLKEGFVLTKKDASLVAGPLVAYLLARESLRSKDLKTVQEALEFLKPFDEYLLQSQLLRLELLYLKPDRHEFHQILQNQIELNPRYIPFLKLESR